MEARGFRDAYKKLQDAGVAVLGISADPPGAQRQFQEKHCLPYTLLSDTDKKVCQAFGVIKEKNMYGKKVKGIARTTFVVGAEGKIAQVFENVKAEGHADQVLEYLRDDRNP
jgi:thioredoxin-dependent peroxiredoxin